MAFYLHSCCKCMAALLPYIPRYLSYSSFYLIYKILYLQDLIGYYTHKSDLLKVERLNQPVPPPEAVNDQKRAIAILPYTKMPGIIHFEIKETTFKFCYIRKQILSFFCQLHKYISQNLDADGHFEVLNMSKSAPPQWRDLVKILTRKL